MQIIVEMSEQALYLLMDKCSEQQDGTNSHNDSADRNHLQNNQTLVESDPSSCRLSTILDLKSNLKLPA